MNLKLLFQWERSDSWCKMCSCK